MCTPSAIAPAIGPVSNHATGFGALRGAGRLGGPGHPGGVISAPAMICAMSDWFRAYGFADVDDDLLVGAYPLDAEDVRMLAALRVQRVLNLVEDEEYEPGQRSGRRGRPARGAGIEEDRLQLVDFGRIPPELLEAAVQKVRGWLERRPPRLRPLPGRLAALGRGGGGSGGGARRDRDRAGARPVQRRKPSAEPLPHQREDSGWWDERDCISRSAPLGRRTPTAEPAPSRRAVGLHASRRPLEQARTGRPRHRPGPARPWRRAPRRRMTRAIGVGGARAARARPVRWRRVLRALTVTGSSSGSSRPSATAP